MALPKCSQLPWPLHRAGAIKMIKIRPMLARIKSNPVSRYLPRNCKAAISATLREQRGNFNSNCVVAAVYDRRFISFHVGEQIDFGGQRPPLQLLSRFGL